ncbi:MAG: hypothetical protein HZA68_13110 [Rhodovulum sp.]|nr:hypothetical protein [Rhodovulum sp.]
MMSTATTAAPARSRRLRAGEYEAALRAAPRIYVQTAWGWQTVRADADEVRTILALTPAGDVLIEQAGADGVLLVQHARGFARPGEAPETAAERDRLREVNAELVAVLRRVRGAVEDANGKVFLGWRDEADAIDAALAKAEGLSDG